MIQHIMKELSRHRFVLASNSPRRKAILDNIGLKFTVLASTFEEDLSIDAFSSPLEFVKETAKFKALDVFKCLENCRTNSDVIIAADTMVVLDNDILGKPKDADDAFNMLTRLNGTSHDVCTGVVIVISSGTTQEECEKFVFRAFHEVTQVTMAHMSAEQIKSYVETGEPLDKAGSYGIQGIGGSFVERLEGDYFNVMGFPLHRFCTEVCDLHNEGLL